MAPTFLPLRRCSMMATTAALRTRTLLLPLQQQHRFRRMMGHSVRIIATAENLPNGGKFAKGDVVTVKAGFARNYLIPQKMAVYATHKNFARLGLSDPHVDAQLESLLGIIPQSGSSLQTTTIKTTAALEKGSQEEHDFKAAELLKHYLRNKVLKIWRNVQAGDASRLHPGMVDARAVRQKLSKQLRIDLEPHEKVYLFAQPLGTLLTTAANSSTTDDDGDDDNVDNQKGTRAAAVKPLSEEEELNALLLKALPQEEDNVQIRQVGDYLARISLRGGYVIPLNVAVLKR